MNGTTTQANSAPASATVAPTGGTAAASPLSYSSLKQDLSLAAGVLPAEPALPADAPPAKGTEGEPPAKDGQAAPAQSSEPLPGDDLLRELGQLAEGLGEQPESPQQKEDELVFTDEQIDKLADPQNTNDYKTKYENLRSLIGRQGNELGKLRAELKTERERMQSLQQSLSAFADMIGFDSQTGAIKPTVKGLIPLIQAANASVDEWNAALEPVGLRVVEAETDLHRVVNELIPDNTKTFEEKLAEIESWDAKRKKAFEDKVLNLKVQREIQKMQRQQQLAEQQRQAEQTLASFIAELQKRPDAKDWIDAVRYWNHVLPAGSMSAEARVKALRALAVGTLAPKLLRKLREDTLAWAAQRQAKAWEASSAAPIGSVPTYVGGENNSAGSFVPQQERSKLMQLVS